MSVALLQKRTKVVEISDELEAFFWVLIYYAVRYLVSNVDDVGNWLEDHFDTFSFAKGKYVCGSKKKIAVSRDGALIADDIENEKLRFGGPLDRLISACLHRFKAHYHVYRHNRLQRKKKKLQESVSDIKLPPSPEPTTTPTPANALARIMSLKLSAMPQPSDPFPDPDGDDLPEPPPTDSELALARKVDTHDATLASILAAYADPNWPAKLNVVKDRVPVGWEPKRQLGPIARSKLDHDVEADTEEVERRKRRRLAHVGPVYNSLPVEPRPPVTPRHRRELRPRH